MPSFKRSANSFFAEFRILFILSISFSLGLSLFVFHSQNSWARFIGFVLVFSSIVFLYSNFLKFKDTHYKTIQEANAPPSKKDVIFFSMKNITRAEESLNKDLPLWHAPLAAVIAILLFLSITATSIALS